MIESVMLFDIYEPLLYHISNVVTFIIIIYREIKMLKAAEEENGSKNESEETCRSSVTIQLDEDEDHFTQSTGKVSRLGFVCISGSLSGS